MYKFTNKIYSRDFRKWVRETKKVKKFQKFYKNGEKTLKYFWEKSLNFNNFWKYIKIFHVYFLNNL